MPPRWVPVHFGSLDGLPVDSANGAAVDDQGFLWLATHDGLARFDGEHFEVYDSMRFPAMSGNRILSINRDDAGHLYAVTEHGDWLAVRTGHIERVRVENQQVRRVRYMDQVSLCVTTPEALYCPDGNGGADLRVRFPESTDAALAVTTIHGMVWLWTRSRQIWLHRDGAWRMVWSAGEVQSPLAVDGAVADREGRLWINIGGRALRLAPDGGARWFKNEGDPKAVLRMRHGQDGHVWMGAINGVFVVRGDRPEAVFVPKDALLEEPGFMSWRAPGGALWVGRQNTLWRLPAGLDYGNSARQPVLRIQGAMSNLFFTHHGTVWVMTLSDGVYRLTRARVDVLDESRGLPGGNVYGVARGRDGTMWLGTLGSGVIAVDSDGSIRQYDTDDGLPGDYPWGVSSAPDGSLYAVTYGPGLWRLQPQSNRFVAVSLPEALRNEHIRAVLFDALGNLWLGTSNGAWQRRDGVWRKVWPAGGHRATVNTLRVTERGMWFGGDEGVWFQNGSESHAVAAEYLDGTTVRNMRFTRDGALWISTVGRGLVRVAADDPQGRQAVQLGRKQGLPSNSPHTLREDANGSLWVNSNQGIFRITRAGLDALLSGKEKSLSPLVLGLADGLSKLEGNGGVQPAAAWDAQGRLWFPSQSGVVRFDPMQIQLRKDPPKAVIAGLESEGQRVSLDAERRLPVDVRRLRIRFGAANLTGSGQTRFRYRLMPQADGWTFARGEGSAVFNGLVPGQYRFELIAGNSDGVWSKEPASLVFRVPPYWYETFAARAAALLGLIVGVLLLMRWRLHRIQQHSRELDRQVRTRTAELQIEKKRVETTLEDLESAHRSLEIKNIKLADQTDRLEQLGRFRERLLADVSHELRTPLMLVSLPLTELATHTGGLAADDRERVRLARHQLARLRALVDQLVHLVQAESGQLALAAKRLDLSALLQHLVVDYQRAAERSEVALKMVRAPAHLLLLADPAHLATIFGNLVDNAIKYAPDGSTVELAITQTAGHAKVEVRDHGPGFEPGAAERLFDRFYRGKGPPRRGREGLGIGLSLVRELVGLHGGRITATNADGGGALFTVDLPLGSDHLALDDLAMDDMATDESTSTHNAPMAEVVGNADGHVLLVEDHPELAAYLHDRLGQRLPTLRASSAEQAHALLAKHDDIRVVVSDVVLPGASGIELCRALSEGAEEARRPVILISAKTADNDRKAGLEAGARSYLAKPFAFDLLLQSVAEAWPAIASRLSKQPEAPEQVEPMLRPALEALGDSDFGINDWANQAHMSERSLRRKVKELTGMTPQLWLREQRLLRVRHLLASGQCDTLADAGNQCGLTSPAYLYRIYRARFGDA